MSSSPENELRDGLDESPVDPSTSPSPPPEKDGDNGVNEQAVNATKDATASASLPSNLKRKASDDAENPTKQLKSSDNPQISSFNSAQRPRQAKAAEEESPFWPKAAARKSETSELRQSVKEGGQAKLKELLAIGDRPESPKDQNTHNTQPSAGAGIETDAADAIKSATDKALMESSILGFDVMENMENIRYEQDHEDGKPFSSEEEDDDDDDDDDDDEDDDEGGQYDGQYEHVEEEEEEDNMEAEAVEEDDPLPLEAQLEEQGE